MRTSRTPPSRLETCAMASLSSWQTGLSGSSGRSRWGKCPELPASCHMPSFSCCCADIARACRELSMPASFSSECCSLCTVMHIAESPEAWLHKPDRPASVVCHFFGAAPACVLAAVCCRSATTTTSSYTASLRSCGTHCQQTCCSRLCRACGLQVCMQENSHVQPSARTSPQPLACLVPHAHAASVTR